MNSRYKIVVIVSLLLIVLSFSITTVNYVVSLNHTEEQLKKQSLPLSLDNIYTVIQKHIIEPYLVSSMMANDTFVQSWILDEEKQVNRIEEYLSAIKNKYGMFTTFLVSQKSGSYYTHDGFIEKVKEDNPNNKWYFNFKSQQAQHEINLDFNEHLSNSLIMFINYKIFDMKYNYLGATGVGLKVSYINDMLKMFRQKHHFKVFFINKDAKIILAERSIIKEKSLDEMIYLVPYKDELISKESKFIEYTKKGSTYLINTKYIPELDLYLLVEANLDDFTQDVKQIFYINIFLSLFISFGIVLIIVYLIRNYNRRLEYLAGNDQLTSLNNRRVFEEKLIYHIQLQQRTKKELSLVFLDVDNFKTINDTKGHAVGDKVLVRIATILKDSIRKTDLLSRWGGEEFVLAYIDPKNGTSLEKTEKIRELIETDYLLKELAGSKVTASFGLTTLKIDDTMDSAITRADNAMYKAKKDGKNRVFIKE